MTFVLDLPDFGSTPIYMLSYATKPRHQKTHKNTAIAQTAWPQSTQPTRYAMPQRETDDVRYTHSSDVAKDVLDVLTPIMHDAIDSGKPTQVRPSRYWIRIEGTSRKIAGLHRPIRTLVTVKSQR